MPTNSHCIVHHATVRLSQKTIEEFKAIVRDEFEIKLSDTEAEQHALRVLGLFDLLISSAAKDSD